MTSAPSVQHNSRVKDTTQRKQIIQLHIPEQTSVSEHISNSGKEKECTLPPGNPGSIRYWGIPAPITHGSLSQCKSAALQTALDPSGRFCRAHGRDKHRHAADTTASSLTQHSAQIEIRSHNYNYLCQLLRWLVVGCWCGCLSAARCRLAYGPADVTVTHCLLLQ